jgi:hypothetical protein
LPLGQQPKAQRDIGRSLPQPVGLHVLAQARTHGIHRLLKADMLGQQAIEALTLTAADVARIARHH